MRNFILILCLIEAVLGAPSKIGTGLTSTLNSKETANICVTFSSQKDFGIEAQSITDRAQKIDFLATNLQNQATSSQLNVASFLNNQSVDYKSFWISNQIFISKANKPLIDLIASFTEVESIEEEIVVKQDAIIESVFEVSPQQTAQSWGIQKIQATDVWNVTRGAGVVVGSIDSGVRYTHQALRSNYRSDYGWYDPFRGTASPNDQDGHGTHTMGTIAGSNGIGVAPASKWISCKGCSSLSCSQSVLTDCGQWILCPTRANGSAKNCSMAPHVVSNSWGSTGSGNNNFYDRVTKAWVDAGIIPVFAIGNDGEYGCSSNRSPGDRSGVIGVGSTNSDDSISYFSSRGPTSDGRVKPDISAPGHQITSAFNGSDTQYSTISGTSMATPHVAGTIALMLSKRNSTMKFDDVRKILERTVDKNLKTTGAECGSVKDSKFPNNHFGQGRLNALKAVNSSRQATLQNDKLILLAFLSFFVVKALFNKQ